MCSLAPRIRSRTRYLAVPRTRAITSPVVAELSATRPLAKYDWPRERTASLNTRETFWAIPIIPSHSDGPIRRPGRPSPAQPPRTPPSRPDFDDPILENDPPPWRVES